MQKSTQVQCKVAVKTIQKDLKLLKDFDLVERKKAINSRLNYFRLKIDLKGI